MIQINKISQYDIGIIWSLVSLTEDNRICFRHNQKYFIESLTKYFKNNIYLQQRSKTKPDIQYVLKTNQLDIPSLMEYGWTERNSNIRNIPIMSDYKDFLRAYIEIHGVLNYAIRYRKDKTKYKKLRLRIYGNINLIKSINQILSINTSVTIKSLEILKNSKTSILNYQLLDEIKSIFLYLQGQPYCKEYWDDINEKLNNPIIDG